MGQSKENKTGALGLMNMLTLGGQAYCLRVGFNTQTRPNLHYQHDATINSESTFRLISPDTLSHKMGTKALNF